MAVKLRLKKMGSKQRPFYRIVAADARSPRDGRFIEAVGTYDPIKQPTEITVDVEKVIKWLEFGALPTDTVKNILKSEGVMAKFAEKKVNAKTKTVKKETPKKVVKKETTKVATKTTKKGE